MNTTKQKVLICDDSITNVLILSKLLETECQVDTITETDPRKVMQWVVEQEFDLLMLDIEMPYLSGIQVMESVRKSYDMDRLPIIILTGNIEPQTKIHALEQGANDFINKPFDQTEVQLRARNLLKVRKLFKQQQILNDELEKKVDQRTRQLIDATEALIQRLALAGELRDNETALHVIRVGKYARILAEKFGLPADLCTMIEKTAPMHDIGKIGIPDAILLKQGLLDDAQRAEMRTHTTIGSKLLSDHPSLVVQMAANIAASHHEKWDGTGYPNRLKGESISIEGRITAISDVFDALTTERPYKKAWPVEEAVDYIKNQAGIAFDPTFVKIFLDNLESFLQVKSTYIDNPGINIIDQHR